MVGNRMELSVDKLKPLIDLLRSENVSYFKSGSLELRLNQVPDKTIVPPPKTDKQLLAEEENMLFYSAE